MKNQNKIGGHILPDLKFQYETIRQWDIDSVIGERNIIYSLKIDSHKYSQFILIKVQGNLMVKESPFQQMLLEKWDIHI